MTDEKRKNVGVLCNIPNGVELRLFRSGFDDGTGKAPTIPYDTFVLKGSSALASGVGNTDPSQMGLGSSPVNEVDKKFMDAWLEQNKMSPLVKQGSIAVFDLPEEEEREQVGDEPLPLGAGGPEGAGATGEGGTDTGTLAPRTGTHEGGASGALAGQGTEGRAATSTAPEAGVVKRDVVEGSAGASETGSSSFMAGAASPAGGNPAATPIGNEPLTGGTERSFGGEGANAAGSIEKAADGAGSGDDKASEGKDRPVYDPELKDFPEGYPKGFILRSEIIPGVFYRSTIDGNKADPDEATGEGWEQITEEEADSEDDADEDQAGK